MHALSDSTLIDQLRSEQNSSYELLYTFYFPTIAHYIKQNSGTNEDAEDIFQEAILVLLQKVREPNFQLTSSLKTYLFAISKNIWYNKLRGRKLKTSSIETENHDQETETFVVELFPEKTEEQKVEHWLLRITNHCQNIIKAIYYYNVSMDSLMSKMGWKNKHTAANQKYKCLEQIKKEQEKEKLFLD